MLVPYFCDEYSEKINVLDSPKNASFLVQVKKNVIKDVNRSPFIIGCEETDESVDP